MTAISALTLLGTLGGLRSNGLDINEYNQVVGSSETGTLSHAFIWDAAGAIAVLHTHSRRLDFHPHVHLVMPAAAIDETKRLWRTKKSRGKSSYLFHHKALALVFHAKMLDAIRQEGLELPARYPETWVVDVKSVGTGEKALVYLGRYLYKGVIQKKDIIACENSQVTFRYRDSKTKTGQIQNGLRRQVSVVDPPACVAQRLQTRPQLRLFTPQQ